jgi:hypothetical protein
MACRLGAGVLPGAAVLPSPKSIPPRDLKGRFGMSEYLLNNFCRRFDLIFKEMGRYKGEEVYLFIDFHNDRRFYTKEEIFSKMGL